MLQLTAAEHFLWVLRQYKIAPGVRKLFWQGNVLALQIYQTLSDMHGEVC